jgi:hypothetical protein
VHPNYAHAPVSNNIKSDTYKRTVSNEGEGENQKRTNYLFNFFYLITEQSVPGKKNQFLI